MKKFLKLILILIIAGAIMSTCGNASYNRGFKDGTKYHQHLINEICHPEEGEYSTTEWSS